VSGGSGKVGDWELAKKVVEHGESTPVKGGAKATAAASAAPPFPLPIILAGGLTPENVTGAIDRVHPWAVDVSGGVEAEGGKAKDIQKVRAFIGSVKQAAVVVS